MNYVDPNRVQSALDLVEGFPFERFVSDFMSAMLGASYVPLGGVNDGGADGILEGGEGRFVQTSIRKDVAQKVRETVRRLREFGRLPKYLTYVSSQSVKFPDRIEGELTDELDVTISIRDANYIKSHINDSPASRAAYANHLDGLTTNLFRAATGALVAKSKHVIDPTVFVFLSQDHDSDLGSASLINDVVDSLILWALEGTDPDQGILMNEAEILARILEHLPTVENLVRPRLKKRLVKLSSKGGGLGRKIRAHRAESAYCLPFETRNGLADDIAADHALQAAVKESFRSRAEGTNLELASTGTELSEEELEKCVEVSLRAMQFTFERQGVQFMGGIAPAFDGDSVSGNEDAESIDIGGVYVADHIAAALEELKINGRQGTRIAEASMATLRGAIYESTDVERTYLGKLSKTYTLLFSLNLEPKLLDYFQQMTGEFYLYVGSDQIVRALSEVYLESADKVVSNTLKLAVEAGARLVLAEPVLEEVWHNLKTSDREYTNTFALVNDNAPFDVVRNSPKILVRAYMYARAHKGKRRPSSWQAFVNQFCAHADLHRHATLDALRRYLQAEYAFEFRTYGELENMVDIEARDSLTSAIVGRTEKIEVLAKNDALMVLSVYGHRRIARETATVSEFGYSTWWLTQESQILRHTVDLVEENRGARFIMRPEFLLNFLTLSPSAIQARAAFKNVFPSLLGVQLSRRMPTKAFRGMLDSITGATDMSEARRAAEISRLADKMKGDFSRAYLSTHDAGEETVGIDSVYGRGRED